MLKSRLINQLNDDICFFQRKEGTTDLIYGEEAQQKKSIVYSFYFGGISCSTYGYSKVFRRVLLNSKFTQKYFLYYNGIISFDSLQNCI